MTAHCACIIACKALFCSGPTCKGQARVTVPKPTKNVRPHCPNMLIKNIDKLNEIIYNIRDEIYLEANMSISEQIKVLCVRSNISMAELARRIGLSPQSFSAKMKRESFTIAELDVIADAVGASFVRKFVLYNGDEI